MVDRDVFSLAVDHWRARSVPLLPGVSENEITKTFAALEYPLTRDIVRLYLLIGGFVDYQMDGVWSLWSLGRIAAENKDRQSPSVWFADFLISSHMFAFRYINADVSAVYVDHNDPLYPPQLVAESLAEFLEVYLRNPDEVQAFYLEA